MKSPTSSLLHSIQALKSKLRNDQLQLQDIRRDFAMQPLGPIPEADQHRPVPCTKRAIPEADQHRQVSLRKRPILEGEQDRNALVVRSRDASHSMEKASKAKITELRKAHSKQIKRIVEQSRVSEQVIIKNYEAQLNQMTALLQDKIKQQQEYIALLQEQINSEQLLHSAPSQTARPHRLAISSRILQHSIAPTIKETSDGTTRAPMPNMDNCKYEQIVDNLLLDNTRLLGEVERLKMENRRLAVSVPGCLATTFKPSACSGREAHFVCLTPAVQAQSVGAADMSVLPLSGSGQPNRSRLRFSKAGDSRSRLITDRSCLSINQNIDTSNTHPRTCHSILRQEQLCGSEWVIQEESSIIDDEIKMRTIRHFGKAGARAGVEGEARRAGRTMSVL